MKKLVKVIMSIAMAVLISSLILCKIHENEIKCNVENVSTEVNNFNQVQVLTLSFVDDKLGVITTSYYEVKATDVIEVDDDKVIIDTTINKPFSKIVKLKIK